MTKVPPSFRPLLPSWLAILKSFEPSLTTIVPSSTGLVSVLFVSVFEVDAIYVSKSDTSACFITSASEITTPSVPAKVTVAWVVADPSRILSSAVVTLALSSMFNSAADAVSPTTLFDCPAIVST